MQLRKDYVLDKWVLISEARGTRPHEFKHNASVDEGKICYFCPGNEHLTPKEITRIPDGDGWSIRVFPNKFPAVESGPEQFIRTDNTFYTWGPAYGEHDIIVETPVHNQQMADLDQDQLISIIRMYRERINEVLKDPVIKYAHLFKNQGGEAGTSLVHSHTQLVSLPLIPAAIKEKLEAVQHHGNCPYCEMVQKEKDSERLCFENYSFLAIAPYASQFNYEVLVLAKEHLTHTKDLTEKHIQDLADIMKKILVKIKELNVSFNFYIHQSPKEGELHFQVLFTPRIAQWAGMELGSGIVINSVAPEDAAKFYREN